MATPVAKRPLATADDDSASLPTRKVPRCDTGGAGGGSGNRDTASGYERLIDADEDNLGTTASEADRHISVMKQSLQSLNRISALELTDSQLDAMSEVHKQLADVIRRAEEAKNAPDQYVLPPDDLQQVFAFLSPADLAASGQTCLHFDVVVQTVVELRIRDLFDEPFDSMQDASASVRCDRFTTKLLSRLKYELERASTLIDMLNASMVDKDDSMDAPDEAEDIFDELKTFHSHVIRARTQHVSKKIIALSKAPKLRGLRSGLWSLLVRCIRGPAACDKANQAACVRNLPPGTLEALTQDLTPEGPDDNGSLGAWVLLEAMPVDFIESHLDLGFSELWRERFCCGHVLCDILERLPVTTLVRHNVESRLVTFMQSENCYRDETKKIARFLSLKFGETGDGK